MVRETQMCFTPLEQGNFLNFSGLNWGPLSMTICSGRPYAAKSHLSSMIVLWVVVWDISMTSSHLERASTPKRSIPLKGPANRRFQIAAPNINKESYCHALLRLFTSMTWTPFCAKLQSGSTLQKQHILPSFQIFSTACNFNSNSSHALFLTTTRL